MNVSTSYRSGWPRVLMIGAVLAGIAMAIALVAIPAQTQRAPQTPARMASTRVSRATAIVDTSAVIAPTIMGRDTAKVVTFYRETFRYSASGHRDPFVSLMKSGDIRPLFSDLKLTTVAYDPRGINSVAVLRDLTGKEQYRVKTGALLGRMRVVRIDPRSVTFTIEEFGFSRQETLSMSESTPTRTP